MAIGTTLLPTASGGLAPLPDHGQPADPGVWLAWPEWTDVVQPVVLILLAGAMYGLGILRLSRHAGRRPGGRTGASTLQLAAMAGALAALLIAMASPLERLAGALFSAHMAQHLLLMVVAAPLLVLARPDRVMLWALPLEGRRVVGRRLVRVGHWIGRLPAVAVVVLYGVALWGWHVPAAYEAAAANAFIHHLEHVTFLGAAALFWARVATLTRGDEVAQWRAIPFLLAGMLIGLTLGLGLTWAPQPWYASHLASAPEWGITPREDQQLGGLLMLIPAMAVHLAVVGLLFARAATSVEQRTGLRPARRSGPLV